MIVVISPHCDDAALSLGSWLSQRQQSIEIWTLFNRSASSILSLPEKEISSVRKKEDALLAARYGWKFLYAELPDTSMRGVDWQKPEIPFNQALYRRALYWLVTMVRRCPETTEIFIPFAVGEHPDHVLAKKASTKMVQIFPNLAWSFYADQPYYADTIESIGSSVALIQMPQVTVVPVDPELKKSMLTSYKSQLSPERIRRLCTISQTELFWPHD